MRSVSRHVRTSPPRINARLGSKDCASGMSSKAARWVGTIFRMSTGACAIQRCKAAGSRADSALMACRAPPVVEGRRSRGRLPEREAILRLAVHAGFLELRGRRTHAELRSRGGRSEAHTSELQTLMRSSYAGV